MIMAYKSSYMSKKVIECILCTSWSVQFARKEEEVSKYRPSNFNF